MKLLFITQKLHGQDAFAVAWAEGFVKAGYDVTVLCLEWRPEEAKAVLGRTGDFTFRAVSMGKEKGVGKIGQITRFWKEITSTKYDRVFIHMVPVWGAIGAPVWIIRKTPVYLWYTHYKMQLGLLLLGLYAKRLFCATPQSMPQYDRSPKKQIVGHGIDLSFWPQRENVASDPKRLLCVHRLSRSKRLEINLRALASLPEYTLDIYGMEAEADYVKEMKDLVVELGLGDRVTFKGSAPTKNLPDIYRGHRLILNMASETIDKTMVEALTCGCYPVTTKRNADAIGLPAAPEADTPEAVAAFIRTFDSTPPLQPVAMYDVARRHSLDALITKMDSFIRSGL